jgi:hypothetical protein
VWSVDTTIRDWLFNTPFKDVSKHSRREGCEGGVNVEFHLAWKVDREGCWRLWYSVDGGDYDVTRWYVGRR